MFITQTGRVYDGNPATLSVAERETINATMSVLDDANPGRDLYEVFADFFALYELENQLLHRCIGELSFQDGLDYARNEGFWANHTACHHA